MQQQDVQLSQRDDTGPIYLALTVSTVIFRPRAPVRLDLTFIVKTRSKLLCFPATARHRPLQRRELSAVNSTSLFRHLH